MNLLPVNLLQREGGGEGGGRERERECVNERWRVRRRVGEDECE